MKKLNIVSLVLTLCLVPCMCLFAQVDHLPLDEIIEIDIVLVEINDRNADFVDRSGVDKILMQANIKLNWLPPENVQSDEIFRIETEDEMAALLRRRHPDPSAQYIYNKYPEHVLIYFLGAMSPNCLDGRLLCGYGGSIFSAFSSSGTSADKTAARHFAHEIGHCLRLDHVTDPHNVMSPSSTNASLGPLTESQIKKMRRRAQQAVQSKVDYLHMKKVQFVTAIPHPEFVSSRDRWLWVQFKGLEPGRLYQIETSQDLGQWTDLGAFEEAVLDTRWFDAHVKKPALTTFFRLSLLPLYFR
jgi:hypothetical protein